MANTTSVAKMTPQELEENVKKAIQLKQQQHETFVRTGGVTKFLSAARHSLLFQPSCNWNDMLSGAPISISIMGSIFIASTSPGAEGILLVPPQAGFKSIKTFHGTHDGDMALSACLAQIAALGSIAFHAANVGMSDIAINSADIIIDVKTVVGLLQDPVSAKISLKATVSSLSKKAKHCSERAKGIASTYHEWLTAACEVHAACCQASTDTAEKQRVNEVHLAAKQVEAKVTDEAVKAAQSTMDTMRTSLTHADEAYQKAAKEYPSGWELIAQEAVSNLVSTATNAINQAIPAVIDAYTFQGRMKEAKQGFSIFQEGIGAIKGEKPNDHNDVTPTKSTTTPMGVSVLPADYQDPAYTLIKSSAGYVSTLNHILTSNNGNIDWKVASGSEGGATGAGFLQGMLEHDLKTLSNHAVNAQPSKDLKLILTECIEVAKAMDHYSAPTMNEKPSADSAEVKGWIEKVTKHNKQAEIMNAISATIPGPTTAPAPTAAYEKVDGGGLRAQIISAATNKLNTTSSVLTSSQKNFQESSESYTKVMTALGAIQGDISKMKADKVELEQIKALLMKCIELLIQLQAQINKLVAFFDSMSLIVDVAVDNQVEPLIARINDVAAQPLELGHYNITLFTAELVFNSMLNVRTYFSLFQDLAEVYGKVHKDYLAEGLVMVEHMMIISQQKDSAKALKAKQDELNKYTDESLPAIKTLLDSREEEVKNGMEKTAEDIANDIQFLPVSLEPSVKAGIDQAQAKAIEAAKSGLQDSGKYYKSPIPEGTFPAE